MSDSSAGKVRFAREVTWGATPSSPTCREMRITSEGLTAGKQTRRSQQVRADRQRGASLETGQAAQGPIAFELAWGVDFELWWETALRSTIASTKIAHASTVFAASSITRAGAGAGYSQLQIGQWFRIKSSGANNGVVAKVASRTSTVITVTGGVTLSVGTASSNIIGRTLKNGVGDTSYFVEVDFTDIAGVKYFTGIDVDQASLSVASGEIVTGVFQVMAKGGFSASTSRAGSTTSALTTTPMTAAVNVAQILENGTVLTDDVQSLTIQISNNMRARPKVASKYSAEHGDGSIDLTGTMQLYFARLRHYEKYLAHTPTSIDIKFSDESGNVIMLQVPRLRHSDGNPQIGGLDQDVTLPLAWEAEVDPTQNATIRMDFLPV